MEEWEWSKCPTVMLKCDREVLWAVERPNRKTCHTGAFFLFSG